MKQLFSCVLNVLFLHRNFSLKFVLFYRLNVITNLSVWALNADCLVYANRLLTQKSFPM